MNFGARVVRTAISWLLLWSVLSAAAAVKYSYDAAGRLIGADYDNGLSISYTYDGAGNVVGVLTAPTASAYSRNYVQKAYVAYYGRPADFAGQTYWAQRMDAEGQSLDAIIGAFGSSDEFNRRYSGPTTAPDSTVVANKLDVATYYTIKIAAGCPYPSEQDGVNALSSVTADPASVTAAKAAINGRCGP
jgi:YD repeat-containing protein